MALSAFGGNGADRIVQCPARIHHLFHSQELIMRNTRSKDMRITILGSGTCALSLRRSTCAVLLECGQEKLLFDCGAGTMRRLLEAGVSVHEISFVFLSHFHPDHSGELASFLFSNKYPDGSLRKKKLTLAGGKGVADFFRRLADAYGTWIELDPDLFRIVEMSTEHPEQREFDAFLLRTAPVAHNPESIAFRVESPGGCSLVYSGDTDVCENLVTLARNADIMICECSLPDAIKVSGHLTPSLAGQMASRAGVKKLVLTHFYPQCDDADIVSECRKTYAGSLVLAEDLMRIPI
ncbi:MAG: ribonuclease Z [Desulfobacterales bacterium]